MIFTLSDATITLAIVLQLTSSKFIQATPPSN